MYKDNNFNKISCKLKIVLKFFKNMPIGLV